MTAHELAQQILAIARKALEGQDRIYIGDTDETRAGLEAIIKLCSEVPPSQEGYKQYEKKEVSHAKNAKD